MVPSGSFQYIFSFLLGFFIGSLPTAYLLVKWKARIDIRHAGSGNVGAMNTFDVTGSKLLGIVVLCIDLMKGVVAVVLSSSVLGSGFWVGGIAGIASVIGHNYSPWLKFHGGRGLATAAGVLIATGWIAVLLWCTLWGIVYGVSKHIHTANIVACILAPLFMFVAPALIQQMLLPEKIPEPPGWKIAAYYQPARAVGGDFYDFLHLPEGRLGLAVGDVADKGVPAALVMATTRSILRAASRQWASAGQVLAQANELLCPDMLPRMFVTCLYAVLDPATGRLQFANAGHDLPYRRTNGAVLELRATGMPLGLMPGMEYEEKEVILAPGDSVIFYSDGLVEAHNAKREMFGFPRLRTLLADATQNGSAGMIDFLLGQLQAHVGPDWEQEDDVTLVALERVWGDTALCAI